MNIKKSVKIFISISLIVVILGVILCVASSIFNRNILEAENEYISNPNVNSLYELCSDFVDESDDIAIKYIPQLCFNNDIYKVDSFKLLTQEKQERIYDEFISKYIFAFWNKSDYDGFYVALSEKYSLIHDQQVLFYYFDDHFMYDEKCSDENKISMLKALCSISDNIDDKYLSLNTVIFSKTMCLSYNLGDDILQFFEDIIIQKQAEIQKGMDKTGDKTGDGSMS